MSILIDLVSNPFLSYIIEWLYTDYIYMIIYTYYICMHTPPVCIYI